MGEFDNKYKAFISANGSVKKSESFVREWYKEWTKFPRVNSAVDFRLDNGRMQAGKIYAFKYNPKTKEQLSFYDRNPVVLSLGPSKKIKNLDLGINLNFLPRKFKVNLLSIIYTAYKSKIRKEINKKQTLLDSGKTPSAKTEKPILLYYEQAKSLIPNELRFAIRSYYINRRKNTVVTSYDKWTHIPLLRLEDIEGVALSFVYKLWKYYK